jgi:GxxExxY protein
MKDKRTYTIIGAAMEVQSADYADFAEKGDQRAYKIIGVAMEVHKELGCEFLEAVYQEAMEREYTYQEIPFNAQPAVQIFYKRAPLNKTYQPDFLCYDQVIVKIKAIANLTGIEEAHLINFYFSGKRAKGNVTKRRDALA